MAKAILSMDDEGNIFLEDEDDPAVKVEIPAHFSRANGLFDEGRTSFNSYDEEVRIATDILISLLQLHSRTCNGQSLHRAVYRLCVPDGMVVFDPADYSVYLREKRNV
jgi:hypothetical protein